MDMKNKWNQVEQNVTSVKKGGHIFDALALNKLSRL